MINGYYVPKEKKYNKTILGVNKHTFFKKNLQIDILA